MAAPAFAQGGMIVSAPVTALGDVRAIEIAVNDGRVCSTRNIALTAQERAAFSGSGRRDFLMRAYLELYDEALRGKADNCREIDASKSGFIAFAEMAKWLKDRTAELAAVEKRIAEIEAKITANPQRRLNTGNIGASIGAGPFSLPLSTRLPDIGIGGNGLQEERRRLLADRDRLNAMLPRESQSRTTGAGKGGGLRR